MNILLFGATGMVGQAALRGCLADPDVTLVQTIGRKPTGIQHPKLKELVHADLFDYSAIEDQLHPFHACFFCLGVSSSGMSEADYTRTTYDLTLAAAQTLARLNPHMTFLYVSGAGTDGSEKGSVMWARIKGKTENALSRLPFEGAYALRPAAILPEDGERSSTPLYRIAYLLTRPFWPLLRRLAPDYIISTRELSRAMLYLARHGAPQRVLESTDLRHYGNK